jgi:carbonic anhydrase
MPDNLIEGFKAFVTKQYEGDNPLMPFLVAEGQNPDYFIVSCIDSRSHAGVIFNTPPGTFFSHKAMGAIVRPYRSGTALAAALQFALEYNKVKTIILLGHTSCGAVKALIEDIDDPEISSFIAVAKEGLANAREDDESVPLQRRAEEHILRLSRRNIETYPSVKKALSENRLTIKSWLFDMHGAALFEHDDTTDEFKVIVKKEVL